jgi:hypothetical protein
MRASVQLPREKSRVRRSVLTFFGAHVCFCGAYGGKADNAFCGARICLLVTHSGHRSRQKTPFKQVFPTGTISSLARAKGRHEFITILIGAAIAPFTDPLTRSSNSCG